jgi:N-acetylglucosaminyl-diphospho-decaprenol L-rhamnosyltransferase
MARSSLDRGTRAPTAARVDAVIVSYNSRETLLAGVTPLLEIPGVTVTVVDNASDDASLDVLCGLPVRALQAGRNGGFGFGCNLGTAAGDAPYVLYLNPDARVERADLERLVAVLEAEPDVGIVGPRLLDGGGALIANLRTRQRASTIWAQACFVHRLLPRARWARELDDSPQAHDEVGYPEWVSGACMLARRSALEQIGGFDEGFFLYSEDMDICARMSARDWRIRYEPGATVRHQEGCSAPRTSLFPVLAQSRVRYARKHFGRVSAAVQRAGVALQELTHILANLARPAHALGHATALRAVLGHDRAPAATAPAELHRDAA